MKRLAWLLALLGLLVSGCHQGEGTSPDSSESFDPDTYTLVACLHLKAASRAGSVDLMRAIVEDMVAVRPPPNPADPESLKVLDPRVFVNALVASQEASDKNFRYMVKTFVLPACAEVARESP